jgi:hypothetical protein
VIDEALTLRPRAHPRCRKMLSRMSLVAIHLLCGYKRKSSDSLQVNKVEFSELDHRGELATHIMAGASRREGAQTTYPGMFRRRTFPLRPSADCIRGTKAS